MQISTYRTPVSGFNTLSASAQPHIATLTTSKNIGEFVNADEIPRGSDSSIIHMTQPTARNIDYGKFSSDEKRLHGEQDAFSPYMLHLIDEPALLTFAEKVLYEAENRKLAALNLDDPEATKRRTERRITQKNITHFYSHDQNSLASHNNRSTTITLNGSVFLEQSPTKPYFANQKLLPQTLLPTEPSRKSRSRTYLIVVSGTTVDFSSTHFLLCSYSNTTQILIRKNQFPGPKMKRLTNAILQ
ncbi:hypothetical protein IMF27_03455 [Pseudomonas sp. PCH199]|uniref:hypothetical protein n=1 Tax=unclassified Pseudomonas TaxID=196821 RepID=UPI000FFB28B6|nr:MULTISPECIES: hypothetical protein [unclassified Pseudomonas]MCW8274880.1 hypothetical protein [Pseudomonas sp. PCH199]